MRPIARAFHVFTAEIGTWWDKDKHILQAPLAEMVFEPFVGGNIIDRGTDGSECRWARVLAYDPPHRVCFSWDINTQWQIETNRQLTSEVEINFTEVSPVRTRVVLTHRHLDRHGEGWESMRDAVSGGWSLRPFAERIEAAGQVAGQRLPARQRRLDARPAGRHGGVHGGCTRDHRQLRSSRRRPGHLGARPPEHGPRRGRHHARRAARHR